MFWREEPPWTCYLHGWGLAVWTGLSTNWQVRAVQATWLGVHHEAMGRGGAGVGVVVRSGKVGWAHGGS